MDRRRVLEALREDRAFVQELRQRDASVSQGTRHGSQNPDDALVATAEEVDATADLLSEELRVKLAKTLVLTRGREDADVNTRDGTRISHATDALASSRNMADASFASHPDALEQPAHSQLEVRSSRSQRTGVDQADHDTLDYGEAGPSTALPDRDDGASDHSSDVGGFTLNNDDDGFNFNDDDEGVTFNNDDDLAGQPQFDDDDMQRERAPKRKKPASSLRSRSASKRRREQSAESRSETPPRSQSNQDLAISLGKRPASSDESPLETSEEPNAALPNEEPEGEEHLDEDGELQHVHFPGCNDSVPLYTISKENRLIPLSDGEAHQQVAKMVRRFIATVEKKRKGAADRFWRLKQGECMAECLRGHSTGKDTASQLTREQLSAKFAESKCVNALRPCAVLFQQRDRWLFVVLPLEDRFRGDASVDDAQYFYRQRNDKS